MTAGVPVPRPAPARDLPKPGTRPGAGCDAEPVPGGESSDRPRLAARLWRRARQPDAYGVVLVAVLLTLIGTGVGGAVAAVSALVQALTLVFAVWTARYPRWLTRATVPVGLAAVTLSAAGYGTGLDLLVAAGEGFTAILVVVTIGLVLGRVGRQPRITLATIGGALSAYLLVPIAYAHAYALIGSVGGPFFASTATARSVDYLYFSLITVTTTGYGDLVARSDLGRMTAASEAVIGQLYLVTVVATVVANVGRTRRHDLRAGPDDR